MCVYECLCMSVCIYECMYECMIAVCMYECLNEVCMYHKYIYTHQAISLAASSPVAMYRYTVPMAPMAVQRPSLSYVCVCECAF